MITAQDAGRAGDGPPPFLLADTAIPEKARARVYSFGRWEIDLTRRELRADGRPVSLGGRAFEIIEVLVQSAGDVITKDGLMARVWPGSIVEENTLQAHMSALRKALGEDRGMLKTVFGRGYSLLGDWTFCDENAPTATVAMAPVERFAAQAFATNIPLSTADLIGRANSVEDLQDRLSTYRMVTLTGPGGIGKTALALEVARSLFPAFQGDAWLVELASLSDPDLVPSAVAAVLGVDVSGDEISSEAMARAIGDKKLLLVLDSCEHVIDAAATLAETVVRMCPNASILATSREVLRIQGEYVYRVAPLDVPPEDAVEPGNVLGHGAVQLFLARTTASHSNLAEHDENFSTIIAICRHLDGIPLAIEFAAARAATLGLRQVAAGLGDRFSLLTNGRRTALPRHQTLRATLDWSYELLPASEQCLLRHLAVFPASFTLDAATAVMRGAGVEMAGIVEGIANLVGKSLVALEGSEHVSRWRLLETIRAYALDKLVESGEAERAARRHAEFFRDLLVPAEASPAVQPDRDGMARYSAEIDNVRVALDWAFSAVGEPAIGVALTAAYVPVWMHLSFIAECRERIERALDALDLESDTSATTRMRLLIALGVALTFTVGSVERTARVSAEALEIAERLDDADAQLQALWVLYALHWDIGQCRVAQSIAERFTQVARRTGDPTVVLIGERLVGTTLHTGGDQGRAHGCFERLLELDEARADRLHTTRFQFDQHVLARAMLARTLWLHGLVDQAKDQAQVSLDDARVTGHLASLYYTLAWSNFPVSVMTGDLDAAEAAVATLIEQATRHNATYWRNFGHCLDGVLLIKRGDFATGSVVLREALETCQRTGWTISYTELLGVLADALAELGRIDEALETIGQALARADGDGERWYVPELLRIKGEVLLRGPDDQAIPVAEECFTAAIGLAREQEALFWELRSALSLGRLRMKQDRPGDAERIVTPVYGRFTEGFDTPDLRSAKAMLESVGSATNLR